MKPFLLISALLASACLAPLGAAAQQQRPALGREFVASDPAQKEIVVRELMRGNASAVALCAPELDAAQLAARFSGWIEANPVAGGEPIDVGFPRMLEETCGK